MTGAELRTVEFRERWRGYDPPEVDRALEQLATCIEEGRLHRAEIDGLRFRTRLRGYHQDDVQLVLDRLVAQAT